MKKPDGLENTDERNHIEWGSKKFNWKFSKYSERTL